MILQVQQKNVFCKKGKMIDSQKFLEALQKNKSKIHGALTNLEEMNDLYLSDVRALISLRHELDYLVEENVLTKSGDWDDLSWEERQNTSSSYRYEQEVSK